MDEKKKDPRPRKGAAAWERSQVRSGPDRPARAGSHRRAAGQDGRPRRQGAGLRSRRPRPGGRRSQRHRGRRRREPALEKTSTAPESPDKPVLVPPRPEPARQADAKRPSPWSLASSGTSPDVSMMPDTTASTQSASGVKVLPAPKPMAHNSPWQQQMTNGPPTPSGVPSDAFAPQGTAAGGYPQPATQPANTATYPSYYPPSSQYWIERVVQSFLRPVFVAQPISVAVERVGRGDRAESATRPWRRRRLSRRASFPRRSVGARPRRFARADSSPAERQRTGRAIRL